MTVKVNMGSFFTALARAHEVNRELADRVRKDSNDFVPMQSGNLASDSLSILDTGSGYQLVYSAPYAHYVFTGKAMGGLAPKHYTGDALNYFKGRHAQAGPDWGARASQVNMNAWEKFVAERLVV